MRRAMVFTVLAEAQRNELKQILQAELKIARDNIVQLKKILKPVSPDNAIGRLSRMDALEMQSVNTSKYDHQIQRLQHIESALAAIDSDEDFGVCLECGLAINLERLKLMPQSRYCVSCLESR